MNTKEREALKLALAVLKSKDTYGSSIREAKEKAIAAAEEALAQPEQEPVGEVGQIDIDEDGVGYAWFTIATDGLELGDKLYTTPPPVAEPHKRPSRSDIKPLTDEEIGAILEDVNAYGTRLYTFARAIEAAHGIKGEA